MGGTRGGSREKQPSWPTLRGSMKGACVCKGQPLGPAPGRKPDPVICDPPPCYHGNGGGESANCWAGKREGRRLCPPRWQDCLFLARLLLPEADFSLQEAVGKKKGV